MKILQKLGFLLGLSSGRGYYNDPINAQREAIKAIQDYTICPETTGNYAAQVYRMMLREDSHLSGLHRRIIFAILSSKISITCENETVQKLVYEQLGYDPKRQTTKFTRLAHQLISAIQYGYAIHQKYLVNDRDSGQTLAKLRFIQPVNVHEFTVQGDDLLSVSETFQESIHGVRAKRKRLSDSNAEVVEIPAKRILHLAPLQLGNNFWGQSFMEPAQPDWILKRIALFTNSVQISRFGAAIPVAKTDVNNTEDVDVIAGQFQLPALDPTRLLVTDTDTQIYFPTPSATVDVLKTVEHYNFSMSKLYLEEFVDIGDKKYGGQQSTTNSSQEFHSSLNFLEMAVVEALTEHANDIAQANFPNPPPIHVGWEDLEFRGRSKLLELMNTLQISGMIENTPEDEVFARDAMGAPHRELDEVERSRQRQRQETIQQQRPPTPPPNNPPAPPIQVTNNGYRPEKKGH